VKQGVISKMKRPEMTCSKQRDTRFKRGRSVFSDAEKQARAGQLGDGSEVRRLEGTE